MSFSSPLAPLYPYLLQGSPVCTDSRILRVGDLFFALDGVHFQGADFIEEALTKGAAKIITHSPKWKQHPKVIVVNNSLDALQSLAFWYRKTLSTCTTFIAITGSNGKTTTKELTLSVLSKKYRCTATLGNLNNHIGIPLTLLRIPLNTDIAIIEMGANHRGEINQYCNMALPHYGLITNISNAHIGEFGSIENILQAKGELYDYLSQKNNGGIFVNVTHTALYTRAKQSGLPLFCYTSTSHPTIEVTGKVLSSGGTPLRIRLYKKEAQENLKSYTLQTQLFGTYNLENIMAAFRIGLHFQVPLPAIINAIENYTPQQHRSQLLQKGQFTFIVDTYNANPQSMTLAIENMSTIEEKPKILILGSMQELGKYSQEEHTKIIQQVARNVWYQVFLIGDEWLTTNYPYHYLYYADTPSAIQAFQNLSLPPSYVLLKGSRKHQLEKFIS